MLRDKAGFVVLLLLAAIAPCWAQSGIRSVTGIVTDKAGNSLPGTVVQLENTITLSVISYITGKDGQYHFNGLSEDVNYRVRAKYRRYWSTPKTLSKFNSSTHPQIDLVIPID